MSQTLFVLDQQGEGGDLEVFASMEDAAAYLEPIDVEQDEEVGFAADGARVEFRVEVVEVRLGGLLAPFNIRRRREVVALSLGEVDPEGLATMLRKWLGRFAPFSIVEHLDELSMEELQRLVAPPLTWTPR